MVKVITTYHYPFSFPIYPTFADAFRRGVCLPPNENKSTDGMDRHPTPNGFNP